MLAKLQISKTSTSSRLITILYSTRILKSNSYTLKLETNKISLPNEKVSQFRIRKKKYRRI